MIYQARAQGDDDATAIWPLLFLIFPLPPLHLSTMARGSGSFKRGGRGTSRFGFRGNTSFRGGRGRGRGRGGAPADAQPQRDEDGNQLAERFEQVKTNDEVDEKLGFARVAEGPTREGWLINMHPVRTERVSLRE